MITKNHKWILLGIFNLFSSLCLVSLALISKYILDAAQEQNKKLVLIYSIVLLGMVVLGVLFKVIENFLYTRFSIAREMELKRILLERRLLLTFDAKTPHSAILMQNYTTDINHILTGEMDVLPAAFYQAGRFVCALVLVAILDWKILLILIGVGLIGLIFARLYARKMKKLHQNVLEKDGNMNSFFQETVENVGLVQAYDAKDSFLEHYEKKARVASLARKRRFHLQITASNLMILVSNLLYASCIGYGGYAIAVGWITYGSLLALTQLIQHLQTPILSVSNLLNHYSLAKTSYERFSESLEGDIVQASCLNDFSVLKVKNLSFGYQSDELVINNLSFELKKGEVARIDGASGIGKTTLLMLLLGFLKPNEGSIDVYLNDEILNGNRASLFAYVPQDNILFSSTIKENFNLLATTNEEEIWDALRFANLADEITSLDMVLNERGKGLSVGQIQRLMIAIAYAKKRPVFLLDEFSSALDSKNALIISNHLKESGKTILYISHKEEQLVTDNVISLEK